MAVFAGCDGYSREAPFSPGQQFAEYPFPGSTVSSTPNPAYEGVRGALELLGLDEEHAGTDAWNPLGTCIQPGDTVVIKPNFVRDFRESSEDHADCLITHGAVVRAVADYALIALKGKGRLVVADAPHNDADFGAIRRIAALDELQSFYATHAPVRLEVYDLRPEQARKIDGVIVGHESLPGDPAGYVRVNLGLRSAFAEINDLCHLLYGSEYDTRELFRHQHDDVHEYMISRTVLDADVVVSVPKLKTHKKVGLTVNLKNLVGINGNKNWLPHHREGVPAQGGDQFSDNRAKHRVERTTVALFKRVFPLLGPLRGSVAGPIKSVGKKIFGDTNDATVRSGNWYGNDTTWRMVLDLNRILTYADAAGCLHDRPVRRFFSIVDGVVGGEGNGPLDATPRETGVIIAGSNAVAVDLVSARLMGFDRARIPILHRSFEAHEWPLTAFSVQDVAVHSNRSDLTGSVGDLEGSLFAFEPHFGWTGHVELSSQDQGLAND